MPDRPPEKPTARRLAERIGMMQPFDGTGGSIDRHIDRIEALLAPALAELEADRERLDWLDYPNQPFSCWVADEAGTVLGRCRPSYRPDADERKGMTVRSTLDAVRKSNPRLVRTARAATPEDA